jgi:hypothetical protein
MIRINNTTICVLVIAMLFLPVLAISQSTFYFKYDENGNRTSRSITLKSAAIENPASSSDQYEKAIDEVIGLRETRIYPNPTKGVLRIEIGMTAGEEANYTLHDLNGKVIIRQTTRSTGFVLNLSHLPSGIYLLHINIGNDGMGWKIIKE